MGRPKIVEGGDPLFQRRYPQISNALKKLPVVQEEYSSTRAPPLLLTDHWAESAHSAAHSLHRKSKQAKEVSEAAIQTVTLPNSATLSADSPLPSPQRTPPVITTPGPRTGGRIVHKAVDPHHPFAHTLTHFEATHTSQESLWEWAMELRAWQDHQSDASRRSRTTKKRKHMSLPPCLLNTPKKPCVAASDEEEPAWNALLTRHQGNTNQAVLYYTALWGDGDAAEAVTANQGYAWRDFVRCRRCLRTGVYSRTAAPAKLGFLTKDWDDLVVRETWEAVLSCARLCTEHKISLGALSAFLAHAALLGEANETVISREVNTTMNAIVHKYIQARIERAKLLDVWYDPDGVDVDEMKRLMDAASSDTSVVLDELEEMKRQLRIVASWQQRINAICDTCNTEDADHQRNDLETLISLQKEGRRHGFRSMGHIELDEKIKTIYKLRDRIKAFNSKEATVKAIATIVKDIHRRRVRFPEANDLLLLHQSIDAWLAEANAAIRCVASVSSVRQLIQRANDLPSSLQDLVGKLQEKLKIGDEWLGRFFATLGYHGDCSDTIAQRIQTLLYDEAAAKQLSVLVDESSSLPVKIEYVNLLQVEIDAHAWTKEAKALMDVSSPLAKLQAHEEAAKALRRRWAVDDESRAAWNLPLDNEVKDLVAQSQAWIQRAKTILCKEISVSIAELVKLQCEGNKIHVDLGKPSTDFTCVVVEAKHWYDSNLTLLETLKSGKVSFEKLKQASLDAEHFSVDIEEVIAVQKLTRRIERFLDAAAVVLGDKRGMIAPLEELASLHADALEQPVDVSSISTRLISKLDEIKAWRECTAPKFAAISAAVQRLREELEERYKSPDQFRRDCAEKENANVEGSASPNVSFASKHDGTSKTGGSLLVSTEAIQNLISDFHRGAKDLLVLTVETIFADSLSQFSQWIVKSVRYLESHREVFDRRFFGAFDRFLNQGKEIAAMFLSNEHQALVVALSCGRIVHDQMKRFEVLLADRNAFVDLCRRAKQAIGGSDRQLSLAQLVELSTESQRFPDICSEINSIRRMASEASAWAQSIRRVVDRQDRIPLDEACSGLQKVKKLGFICEESRMLSDGVKVARNWSRRVHRLCKEEDPDISKVKALLSEYDKLIIDMADDVELLSKTQTRYCICQQAHKGFMVCCEDCDDWFHGACVGVTEKSAKKRFVCLRCNIVKTYQLGAANITTLVRKWSSVAELKKARLADLKKLTLKENRQRQSLASVEVEKTSILASLKEKKGEPLPSANKITVANNVDGTQSTLSKEGEVPVNSSMITKPQTDAKTLSHDASRCVSNEKPVGSQTHNVEPQPVSMALQDKVISSQLGSSTANSLPIKPCSIDIGSSASAESPEFKAVREISATVQAIEDRTMQAPTASVPAHSGAIVTNPQATPAATSPKAPNACKIIVPDTVASDFGATKAAPIAKVSPEGSEADLLLRLEKLDADATKWMSRIQNTVGQRNDLARGFITEDAKYNALQTWVHGFRSTIFAPETEEKAKLAMPLKDGSHPEAMKQLIDEARKVGIDTIPDIASIIELMECLAWCLRSTVVFARQPSLSAVTDLLTTADGLSQIPNLSTIKSMKNLAVKVRAWEKLVKEEIQPVPGKRGQRFNDERIKKMLSQCDNLPLRSSYESRLVSVIEDGFLRHCLCGGPSDGRFMIGCDKCNQWFHGCCVGKSNEDMIEDNSTWLCPICTKSPVMLQLERFHYLYDVEEDEDDDDSIPPSPKAPKVEQLWPPIGLLQSEKAQKALGLETSLRMRYHSIHATPSIEEQGQKAKHLFLVPLPVGSDPKSKSTANNRCSAVTMRSTIPIAVYGPPAQPKSSAIAPTAHLMPAPQNPQRLNSMQSSNSATSHAASDLQIVHHAQKDSSSTLTHPVHATAKVSSTVQVDPQKATATAGVKRPREEVTEAAAGSNGTAGSLLHGCHRQKISGSMHGPGSEVSATDSRMTVDLAGNA